MANVLDSSSSLIDFLEVSLTTDGFRWPKDIQFPRSYIPKPKSDDHRSKTETMKAPSTNEVKVESKNDKVEMLKTKAKEYLKKVEMSNKRKLESTGYGDDDDQSKKRSRVLVFDAPESNKQPSVNITKKVKQEEASKAAPKKRPSWFARINKERDSLRHLSSAPTLAIY